MDYYKIISCLFVIISLGSNHIGKEKTKHNTNTLLLDSLLFLLLISSFVLLTSNLIVITGLKWYWSFAIGLLASLFLSVPFAIIYTSVFGLKTKPQLSLLHGTSIKHNLHFADAAITFAIGFLLYFLS